ncbi:hypothetical protein [Desulforhopalus sp. 52FAK]
MTVKKSKVAVNIKKNRLTITVAEEITKKSVDNIYTEIRFGVADLKPGFDVITDLSACSLAALNSLPTFRKITNHLVNARVGRVVRVIDETKIIKKQMINMAGQMQGYTADIFNSLEAADEFLANSTTTSGLSFALQGQDASYVHGDREGTAIVVSLSVHICEMKKATFALEEEDSISFSVKFAAHEGLLEEFKTKAVVTWVDGDRFCVRFEDVDTDLQEQLWNRLVHESQCDLS